MDITFVFDFIDAVFIIKGKQRLFTSTPMTL
jgi:hypothetical protein